MIFFKHARAKAKSIESLGENKRLFFVVSAQFPATRAQNRDVDFLSVVFSSIFVQWLPSLVQIRY